MKKNIKNKVGVIGSIVLLTLTLFTNILFQNNEIRDLNNQTDIEKTNELNSVEKTFEIYKINYNEINTNNILFAISYFTSIINSNEFKNNKEINIKLNELVENSKINYISSNYPKKLSKIESQIIETFFNSYYINNENLDTKDFIFYLTQMANETIIKLQRYDFQNL